MAIAATFSDKGRTAECLPPVMPEACTPGSGFVSIPIWLIGAVSAGALALYVRLAADESGVWLGTKALAKVVGEPIPTVRRHLYELRDAGALEIVARQDDEGRTLRNAYRLRTTRAEVVETDHRGDQNWAPPCSESNSRVVVQDSGSKPELIVVSGGGGGTVCPRPPALPPSFPPQTPPNHPPTHPPTPGQGAGADARRDAHHPPTGTNTPPAREASGKAPLPPIVPPPPAAEPEAVAAKPSRRQPERKALDLSWADDLPPGEDWAEIALGIARAIGRVPKYATVTVQPTRDRAESLARWLLAEAPDPADVRAFLLEWELANSGDEKGRWGTKDPLGCLHTWARSKNVHGRWVYERNLAKNRAEGKFPVRSARPTTHREVVAQRANRTLAEIVKGAEERLAKRFGEEAR